MTLSSICGNSSVVVSRLDLIDLAKETDDALSIGGRPPGLHFLLHTVSYHPACTADIDVAGSLPRSPLPMQRGR